MVLSGTSPADSQPSTPGEKQKAAGWAWPRFVEKATRPVLEKASSCSDLVASQTISTTPPPKNPESKAPECARGPSTTTDKETSSSTEPVAEETETYANNRSPLTSNGTQVLRSEHEVLDAEDLSVRRSEIVEPAPPSTTLPPPTIILTHATEDSSESPLIMSSIPALPVPSLAGIMSQPAEPLKSSNVPNTASNAADAPLLPMAPILHGSARATTELVREDLGKVIVPVQGLDSKTKKRGIARLRGVLVRKPVLEVLLGRDLAKLTRPVLKAAAKGDVNPMDSASKVKEVVPEELTTIPPIPIEAEISRAQKTDVAGKGEGGSRGAGCAGCEWKGGDAG